MKPIRTIVVDDHDIIRYALKQLFSQHTEEFVVEIVGEADNGRRAVQLVEQWKPDLVIMDIAMPELNGIEATRQIRSLCPGCRIVILTTHSRRQHLRELIQLGISGYVNKSCVTDELFSAVRSAVNGQIFLSPTVTHHIAEDYAAIMTHRETLCQPKLSPRQREVLQLMVEGKATKEIATLLHVSPKAIESVRHRIMRKLEMDNLADLTKYAIREGLTTLEF